MELFWVLVHPSCDTRWLRMVGFWCVTVTHARLVCESQPLVEFQEDFTFVQGRGVRLLVVLGRALSRTMLRGALSTTPSDDRKGELTLWSPLVGAVLPSLLTYQSPAPPACTHLPLTPTIQQRVLNNGVFMWNRMQCLAGVRGLPAALNRV